MSAVSLAPPVPLRRRFPLGQGTGLAGRVGHGLVTRAVAYPDQFTRRYGGSRPAPSR